MLGITPNLLGAAATLHGVGATATALLQARQIVRRSFTWRSRRLRPS